MKMKNLTGLIIVLLMTIATYGQWNQQTSGTTNLLNEVYFVNQDTGYVVGTSIILKTENGGTTWQSSFTGSFLLEGVCFTSLTNGFAVGYNLTVNKSTIIKTTDAGANWTVNNLTTTSFLNDIYFVDSNTGFIVGSDGKAFRTTDGGISWDTLNTGTTERLQSVFFSDSQNGIIVGGFLNAPLLLKTTDGGNNWNIISTPATNFLQGVFFPSSSIGYAVGWDGDIIKTTDGGNNWSAQTSVANYGNLDVFFVNDLIGYIVGGDVDSAGIQKTTDGGQNWNSQTTLTSHGLIGVFFPTINTGYSVGEGGTILKIIDNNTSGLADYDNSIQLSTYPNPFVNEIHISVVNEPNKKMQLQIYDLRGSCVFQLNDYVTDKTIDLSELSSGTYILIVEVGDKKLIRKLVKG
jgi:photosystem II stability/assembly factor-like uncharacterized protein